MADIKSRIQNDPYLKLLDIKMEDIREGSAQASVIISENMLNFLGVIHGGLIFSLADAVLAAASNYDHSPSYALDVSGSFLATADVGDRLIAKAERIHTSKRLGLYRMEVFLNDKLLATFNGTVFRKY